MKFNMNDRATVRLTEAGKKIALEYEREWVSMGCKPRITDKPLAMPLWELFQIFGAAHSTGRPTLFFDNVIEIETDDEVYEER